MDITFPDPRLIADAVTSEATGSPHYVATLAAAKAIEACRPLLDAAIAAERETTARYRRILGGLHLAAEIVHGEAESLLADLADDASAAGIDLAAIRAELKERAGERVRSRLRRARGGR